MAITRGRAHSIEYSDVYTSGFGSPASLKQQTPAGMKASQVGVWHRKARWAAGSLDCIIFHCQIHLKCQFWQITPSFNLISSCECLFSFKHCAWMYMYGFGVQELSTFSKWTRGGVTHACLWNKQNHRIVPVNCRVKRFSQQRAVRSNGFDLKLFSFH